MKLLNFQVWGPGSFLFVPWKTPGMLSSLSGTNPYIIYYVCFYCCLGEANWTDAWNGYGVRGSCRGTGQGTATVPQTTNLPVAVAFSKILPRVFSYLK